MGEGTRSSRGSAILLPPPLGSLLEAVVADLEGGVEGGFEVALVEELVFLLAVEGPDSGEVIGLEFEADRHVMGLGGVARSSRPLDEPGVTQELLDVVADL